MMATNEQECQAILDAVLDHMLEESRPFFEEENKAAMRDIIRFGVVQPETIKMRDEAMKRYLASIEQLPREPPDYDPNMGYRW